MSAGGDPRRPLPTAAVVLELARATWVRAARGKALWLVCAIAALPAVLGLVLAANARADDERLWRILFEATLPLLDVIAPVLVASAVADEIEDKTAAYLWSRALPRWTVVIGKLVVLGPLCALVLAGSILLAAKTGRLGDVPSGRIVDGAIGLAAAGMASAAIAAAIATLVPRHAVALTMGWMIMIDWPLHFLNVGLRHLSTTFGASAVAGFAPDAGDASGLITLAVLGTIATAVACWRIGKIE